MDDNLPEGEKIGKAFYATVQTRARYDKDDSTFLSYSVRVGCFILFPIYFERPSTADNECQYFLNAKASSAGT